MAVGKDIDYLEVEIPSDFKPEKYGMELDVSPGKYIFSKEIAKKDKSSDNKLHKLLYLAVSDFVKNKKFKGKDLIGKKYKPLFDYYSSDKKLENRENGWKIYSADFVTTEDGTGVVHIAPAFGEDDMNLGKEYSLPFVQHLTMDGNFKSEVKDFQGLNVKPKDNHMSTDIEIIKYLAHNNLLFHKEKYEHSYPHCWRCDTPLINYATSSWFVNVTKIKKRSLETAKEINWSPAHIKEGRFGNWLEGARDWSISRQRFWASVMPIWKCNKCEEIKVFGSVKELEKDSNEKITDLHKHIVDKIKFGCVKCNGEMTRIPDVLDTWFDSGSMPYAQMHYPFENKEKFDKNFPAEFIAEGQDQCRAWFYYLHLIGTAIKDGHTFNNVIVNGIVLAEDGKKMAKRLQNYPDPSLLFDQYGADALRYYLMTSNIVQADNLNFSEDGVKESFRKVVMILWNVVKFYDLFEGELKTKKCKSKNVLDKWILARLDQLIQEVTENMNAYHLPKSTRPIADFIDDLSTWYIRRSRDRFKGEDENDKQAALATTKFVLTELSKIMAPFTPFIAEQVWQKVTGNNFEDVDKSVHLESFPIADNFDNDELIRMGTVRKLVEVGLAKRDEYGIKIRQPLVSLIVKTPDLELITIKDKKDYLDLLKDELNVKKIIFKKVESGIIIDLDTKITEELKLEGIKREMVRVINNIRKNKGFVIQDNIKVYYETKSKDIKKVLTDKKLKQELLKDVLAKEIIKGIDKDTEDTKTVKINKDEVILAVVKV